MFGVTSPISVAEPKPEDILLTQELEAYLKKYGSYESHEEFTHRTEVLLKLNSLVKEWIKDVGEKKNMPLQNLQTTGGQIYTFGSYRLGVHNKGSDIDAVCVAPRHVQREDFFTSFAALLRKQPEVKNLRTIEDAYVPVMKMVFEGIDVDLLFARLALKEIPQDLNLKDSNLLKNLDIKCVRSLNGPRTTDEILNLIPNRNNFKIALRTIKLWAKRYLGGVSWALLVARVCQLYPTATASTLVEKFFLIYTQWPWPRPITLKKAEMNRLNFEVWDPIVNVSDRFHLMPIITPAYPHQNSTFNVSYSTRTIIQEQIKTGCEILSKIISKEIGWSKLFEEENFFAIYNHFIVLIASARTKREHLEWHGLIESRIRILISSLESRVNIQVVHINPETYTPLEVKHDTYSIMWFIGLKFSRTQDLRIDLTEDIQNFINKVAEKAPDAFLKGMKIEANHVKRKQLSEYLPSSGLYRAKKKEKTPQGVVPSKKRSLDED